MIGGWSNLRDSLTQKDWKVLKDLIRDNVDIFGEPNEGDSWMEDDEQSNLSSEHEDDPSGRSDHHPARTVTDKTKAQLHSRNSPSADQESSETRDGEVLGKQSYSSNISRLANGFEPPRPGTRKCAVCGSTQSPIQTVHGVRCCGACTKFFYTSKGSSLRCVTGRQDCPINTDTRAICRYCRLAKCHAVGMTKHPVAEDDDSDEESSSDEEHDQSDAETSDDVTGADPNPGHEGQTRQERSCTVCGSKKLVHRCYGAVTCRCCASFYYYYVNRSSKNLTCLTGLEDCIIDDAIRPFCSFCRLKKCVALGFRYRTKTILAPGSSNKDSSSSTETVQGQSNTSDDTASDDLEDSSDSSSSQDELPAEQKRECAVCHSDNDIHRCYDRLNCNSCRVFYRQFYELQRSATDLVCRTGQRNCTVTITSRPHCSYCRFKKCVASGFRTRPELIYPEL